MSDETLTSFSTNHSIGPGEACDHILMPGPTLKVPLRILPLGWCERYFQGCGCHSCLDSDRRLERIRSRRKPETVTDLVPLKYEPLCPCMLASWEMGINEEALLRAVNAGLITLDDLVRFSIEGWERYLRVWNTCYCGGC